ncbi:hypothetical protein A3Q56_04630 [Intoshia linei]|uniref:Cysteine protease n=1 Tax=Intoshia linei TaxID=1819745 RepID=A0A177B1M1_9BILA|nr:hypothetical protein A3Q56_04630 [Intoshia linei]
MTSVHEDDMCNTNEPDLKNVKSGELNVWNKINSQLKKSINNFVNDILSTQLKYRYQIYIFNKMFDLNVYNSNIKKNCVKYIESFIIFTYRNTPIPNCHKNINNDIGYTDKEILNFCAGNSSNALFGLTNIVKLIMNDGKDPINFIGPNAAAFIFRNARQQYESTNLPHIYVAVNSTIYINDLKYLCFNKNPNDTFTPTIVLIPIRLGATNKINSIYLSALKLLFNEKEFTGFVGGRIKGAFYFVGYQRENFIVLNPHHCQENANIENSGIESYRCQKMHTLKSKKIDPTCMLSFYLANVESYTYFIKNIRSIIESKDKSTAQLFAYDDRHHVT